MELQIFTVALLLICAAKENQGCFTTEKEVSMTIKSGASFYQECRCTESVADEGVKWIDPDGSEIDVYIPGRNTHMFTEKQADSVRLYIPKVSKQIAGAYKCITVHNKRIYQHVYSIFVYDPLYFYNTNQSQFITQGMDSYVSCQANGDPQPLISWYKDEGDSFIPISNDDKYEIDDKGLKIKRVSNEDNGMYKCAALVLQTGEGDDRVINVDVVTLPQIEELKASPNKTVTVGQSLSIECLARGTPHPEYVWTKISGEISGNVSKSWRNQENTIYFEDIKPSDRGSYQCETYNIAGEATAKIDIEVLEPPVIYYFKNLTILEGSTEQMICQASGRSAPTITIQSYAPENKTISWHYEKLNLDYSRLVLSFMPVLRAYEGEYICNASNEVGFVTESVSITVLHKPYIVDESEVIWGWQGQVVNLTCNHESNPPAKLTWRYHGNNVQTEEQVFVNKLLNSEDNTESFVTMNIDEETLYGIYECIATNEHGEAKKMITLNQALVPPAVQNISIMFRTATAITLDIRPPEPSEGPPVIGFIAQYDDYQNYQITNIHKNRTWSIDRPFKIDKLKPNTHYVFRVAAISEVGTGAWSGMFEFITSERSAPQKPQWDMQSEELITSTDLNVKWKPADSEDIVDYYIITFCPIYNNSISRDECSEDVLEETTTSLGCLDTNTTYLVELIAHNMRGNSSKAERFITTPAQLPSALSAGAMVGLSAVAVALSVLLLDVSLFYWRRVGMIASCYHRKNNKRNRDLLKDRKGLLNETKKPPALAGCMKKPHNEFEYNKSTGVITGKHSAV